MKLQISKGATSQSLYLFIADSSSPVGAGLTGLAFNSSGLTAYYVRPAGNATAISLATLASATAAYSSGGFKEIDATNMPGVYRFDVPDAVLAAGAPSAIVMLKGAANMTPVLVEVQLVSFDPNDAVRLGLTALPNVASGSSGAIPTTGTGANQIAIDGSGNVTAALTTSAVAAVWSALTSGMSTAGSIGKKLKDWTLGSDNKALLSSDAQSGVTIPTVTTLTNAPADGTTTTLLKDLLRADRYIDTGVSPWALVLIRQGTGALGAPGAVELLRQKLYDVGGAPVASANTVLGRSVT